MEIKQYILENNYNKLSKFKTLIEFNNHFEQAMLFHKSKFTKGEHLALNKLRKFAAEIYGVAWCKLQNAAIATHKDEKSGVSRRTFDRMLVKAKKLNLITVIHQHRKNKYQKHSVYVFNRLEELTPEKFEIHEENKGNVAPNEPENVIAITSLLLKLPVLKDYKTYSQAKDVPTKETVINFEENKTDYQKMKDMVSSLFKDHKTIYKLYGVWLGKLSKLFYKKPPFDMALRAVQALIREVKRRISLDLEPLNKPVAYFSGILTKMINKWNNEQLDRYESDWEQALIEDHVEGLVYESDNVPAPVETPATVISLDRYEQCKQYLESKTFELEMIEDSIRYIRRKMKLFKYEKILNECEVQV